MDYKEKLEKAMELYPTANADQRYVLECLFPELAENRDERILEIIKHCIESRYLHTSTIKGISQKECFAWLEKQGESYTKRDVDNAFVEGIAFAKDELEKQGKKKSPDEVLKIRQELYQSGYNDGYKHGCEDTKKQGEQNLANSAKTCKKSQRMISAEAKEALYDKPATIDIDKMVDDYANNEEFGKPLNSMIRAYRQGLKDAIGKVASESAWSEEDDVRLQACLDTLQAKSLMGVVDTNMTKWLKSLKQRIGG